MLTDKAPQSPVVSTAGRVITPQQVNLPKLALPVFHDDPMKWAVFWERFQASVHNNDNLEPSHKLTYLREAIKDPAASPLLYTSSSSPTQYEELIQVLISRYDRKRLIHKNYSLALVNCNSITKGAEEEIRSLMDTVEYNLRGLKQTGQDDLNTCLTSLFETKFPKRLHESWREYSKDFKTVPPIQDLLAFLKEKMDTLPEMTPAKAEHKLEYKKLKTSVQAIQPTPPTNKCYTSKGERHALYLCPSYKSMDTDARYSHVRSLNLCFNCLGSGHRTKECRSNCRCKKCSKSHHATLHKIMPSNAKNAVSTSLPDAHQQDDATVNTVELRSALQPTLQMTSQVLLQSASGKQVMVRALLDPGASISLITN